MEVEYYNQEEMHIEKAINEFDNEQITMREKKSLLESYYRNITRQMFPF